MGGYGQNDYGCPKNLGVYLANGIITLQNKFFFGLLKGVNGYRPMRHEYADQEANDLIRNLVASGKPFLVSRFGTGELNAAVRGWDISRKASKIVKFLGLFTGDYGPLWWDNSIKLGLIRNAGVFPVDDDSNMRFADKMLESSRQIDVLASWIIREAQLAKAYFPTAKAVSMRSLVPFFFDNPWSSALKKRKVLVVHPFAATIDSQYKSKSLLFADTTVLPDFELVTYKSVMSFAGIKTPYKDWFEALDKMCSDIADIDFDIALIGCGAYGMPIGAFIKRDLHRQAIHIGGALQLLFGIKGSRWDDREAYRAFYNEHWVRPDVSERPVRANDVEGACYW